MGIIGGLEPGVGRNSAVPLPWFPPLLQLMTVLLRAARHSVVVGAMRSPAEASPVRLAMLVHAQGSTSRSSINSRLISPLLLAATVPRGPRSARRGAHDYKPPMTSGLE